MTCTVGRFEPPPGDGLRTALARFDCVTSQADGVEDPGEAMVRDFLREGGCEQGALSGTSTTYLAVDPELEPALVGYVTLAATQLRLSGGEKSMAPELANVHHPDFGAIRIAMIGAAREHVGKGYGRLLLDTVVAHTVRMSADVSIRFIVADAVTSRLEWYRRQGFVENRSEQEATRLERVAERTGISAVSVRLDLGPDPRRFAPA